VGPIPTDLNRFQQLPDEERMRVIIRVLCGLVAIEPDAPTVAAPEPVAVPETASRRSRFRLPFLGLEAGGERKLAVLNGAGR
jgi:hypothetical protein